MTDTLDTLPPGSIPWNDDYAKHPPQSPITISSLTRPGTTRPGTDPSVWITDRERAYGHRLRSWLRNPIERVRATFPTPSNLPSSDRLLYEFDPNAAGRADAEYRYRRQMVGPSADYKVLDTQPAVRRSGGGSPRMRRGNAVGRRSFRGTEQEMLDALDSRTDDGGGKLAWEIGSRRIAEW